MTAALDDLTADNLYSDPYPVYARLRREAPVRQFEPTGEWFVTRWKDCHTVGAKDAIFGPSDSDRRPEARVMGMPNILSLSGPEHQCLRQGVDADLQPERVNQYIEGLARPIVLDYVKALRARGEGDLTTELFEPISVRVVASVLGLHDVTNATLAQWFHAMNGGLQNVQNDPEVWATCDRAIAEIDDVLRPMVERVTRTPDETMISHIVHGGTAPGYPRTFEAIMPTIRVILLGGLQEPGHGAANAVYGLLTNPEQSKAVAQDPAGLSLRAYDEGLRWIAPIGVTPRVAREDFELADVVIPKGASVAIVLASANRDETRFENGEDFRIDRQLKPHAAFGYRPHFCSGHYLSRAAGRIAIEEAYRALPNLRLDTAKETRIKGWRFRGVINLPAVWDA